MTELHLVAQRTSKFRREEGGGDWRDALWFKHRTLSGVKDLAMCEKQAVMGTRHGIPSEITPANGPVTLSCTFWTLKHEMQHIHTITSSRNIFYSESVKRAVRGYIHTTHTHAHTDSRKVCINAKSQERRRERILWTEDWTKFFTTCELNESQIAVGFFPSIFQFVLFCKHLYSNDNVTFVVQPRWLPREELYFESEDIC